MRDDVTHSMASIRITSLIPSERRLTLFLPLPAEEHALPKRDYAAHFQERRRNACMFSRLRFDNTHIASLE